MLRQGFSGHQKKKRKNKHTPCLLSSNLHIYFKHREKNALTKLTTQTQTMRRLICEDSSTALFLIAVYTGVIKMSDQTPLTLT